METQNVTLSIPKETLQKIKLLAVGRGTSVSALLTRTLERLVEQEDDYARARQWHLQWLEHGADLGTKGQVLTRRDSFMNEAKTLQFVDTDVLIYAHDLSAEQKRVRFSKGRGYSGYGTKEQGCLQESVTVAQSNSGTGRCGNTFQDLSHKPGKRL